MRKQTGSANSIVKVAFIRHVKGKGWCVFGHKKTQGGKRRNFGCYGTKEKAQKRLGQIYFFKGRGALDGMVEAADELDRKGLLHYADALMGCFETAVAVSLGDEDSGYSVSVRLGKIASLLERRGEPVLAERLDALIPDILDIESGTLDCPGCPDTEVSVRSARGAVCSPGATADRVYATARRLRELWRQGLVDDQSYEHRKFRELRCMLKAGYLLPPPSGKEVPADDGNWWDFFEGS